MANTKQTFDKLPLIKAWQTFKDKVNCFAMNVDECTVELYFESSLSDREHYTFHPDEAVFISDVIITPRNEVAFTVPFGDKFKAFRNPEAELIKTVTAGTTEPLNQILNKLFKESFVDINDCPTITHLERKFLVNDGELRDNLNNSSEYIAKYELDIERSQHYTKLDDFGMF